MPGVEGRIGDNQELQVHRPSVMQDYCKRADDTVRVLAPDGWLRTRQRPEVGMRQAAIMGRIKEIIVTSTGEEGSPGDLELAIVVDPPSPALQVGADQKKDDSLKSIRNRLFWLSRSG